MTTKLRKGALLLTTMLMAGSLTACSGSGIPKNDEFDRIADTSIKERSSDARRTAQDAVNFFSEKPVTLLKTNPEHFSLTTDPGQQVPEVPIGQINAAPMEFGALLHQIADQAGMNWRISGAEKDDLMGQEIYFVQRSETMLKTVLDELSELTGAFYRVEGDRIIFSQDQLFIARVPRMADSQDILVDGLGSLGADEIFADTLSGTVTFRATRPVYEGVKRLMTSLELGRDMIVYDFWIIDRNLSDSSGIGAGLKFGDLETLLGEAEDDVAPEGLTIGGTSIIENLGGGGGDQGMVVGNIGDIGVEATARFLRSLGKTETVARPTISMLSGGESSFTSGEKSEYIRSVETSTSDSSTSSGTDVRSLETGVKIEIGGAYNGGVISTDFEIDVSELIAFEEFDTGDVTLRLPKTAQRVLSAHLEARPGDVMVLGGIIRDKEDIDQTEIVGIGAPTQKGKAANKTETIILVRPRLVQIRPVEGEKKPGSISIESGVSEIAPEENPISDVIDEEAHARGLLSKLKAD